MVGLLGGMKGAAEYEEVTGFRGKGTKFMLAQSFSHVIVVFFIVVGNLAFFLTRRRQAAEEAARMSGLIGVWIGAFLTLGILSFLYKDNPVYKVCEAIFVGISAGYWFVSLFWQTIWPRLVLNLRDATVRLAAGGGWDYRFIYVIAAILGIMMLMRLPPQGGMDLALASGLHRRFDGGALLHHVSSIECDQPDP